MEIPLTGERRGKEVHVPPGGGGLCLSHGLVLLLVLLGLSPLHLANSIALDYSRSVLRNGLYLPRRPVLSLALSKSPICTVNWF